jgi:hypothetical protein
MISMIFVRLNVTGIVRAGIGNVQMKNGEWVRVEI